MKDRTIFQGFTLAVLLLWMHSIALYAIGYLLTARAFTHMTDFDIVRGVLFLFGGLSSLLAGYLLTIRVGFLVGFSSRMLSRLKWKHSSNWKYDKFLSVSFPKENKCSVENSTDGCFYIQLSEAPVVKTVGAGKVMAMVDVDAGNNIVGVELLIDRTYTVHPPK